MTRSQGYCTAATRSRPYWATGILAIAHLAAAALANWPSAAGLIANLQMRPDLAFYHYHLWRLATGGFFFTGHFLEAFWLVLFLLLFGRNLEKQIGSRETLWFYLVAGTGCSLIWGVSAAAWADDLLLETSGAITAVIALSLLFQTDRRFVLWRRLVIPAWALGILYYGVELRYYAWDSWTLAIPVHLGGAICALLYRQFDLRLARLQAVVGSRLHALADFVSQRGRLRQNQDEKPHSPPPEPTPIVLSEKCDPTADDACEQDDSDTDLLEEQLDRILSKISQSGSASLTEHEKSLLLKASEKIRRRRFENNKLL